MRSWLVSLACAQEADDLDWSYMHSITATHCSEHNGTKGFEATGDE